MMMKNRKSQIVLVAIASGLVNLCLTTASAFGQYCNVQDLGSLSTTFQQSVATGINNSGEVAGWTGIHGNRHAFLFQDGVMKDLGTLASDASGDSMAFGINNRGEIVGSSTLGVGKKVHAFLIEAGQMTDLGTLSSDPANHNSQASAINDRSQVVGSSETDGMASHAFLYENGKMSDLGTLPGHINSGALAINNRGQIVGYSSDGRGTSHAFLYENGTMTDLGTLPGDPSSAANGINERGQIVGDSYSPQDHPFLFYKGAMVNLAGSGPTGVATAINSRGDAVGYATPTGHALLFRKDQVIDISQAPGTTFLDAQGINDPGQIVGIVMVPSAGLMGYHAAVCTPVK
jgi:probable HAF family extracellular repeat protein